jgi:hypothetical protein
MGENAINHSKKLNETLILLDRECCKVNTEELDWRIYHMIPAGSCISLADLAAASGLSLDEIEPIVARLERYLLIERSGDAIRGLSFGESLIRCQVKYDRDLPFIIENGVIKPGNGGDNET